MKQILLPFSSMYFFCWQKKSLIQFSCFLYYITLALTKKFVLESEPVKTWKKSHQLVFTITQV